MKPCLNAPLRVAPLATEPIHVRSPLSTTIVLTYDPSTKETWRAVCPECLALVRGDRDFSNTNLNLGPFFGWGIGDPIYFLAAGVEYETLVVPRYGRIAWEKTPQGMDNVRNFVEGLWDKKSWRNMTGFSYPFRLFRQSPPRQTT